MEHVLLMNQSGLRSLESHLGVYIEDTFILSEQCYEALQEVDVALDQEDKNLRTFRRQLYTAGMVHKSFVPVLSSLYSDENQDVDDKEEILNLLLKILARISQPPDCLLPSGPGSATHGEVAADVSRLVESVRREFTHPGPIRIIMDQLLKIVNTSGDPLDPLSCDTINYTLFLFRNLIYNNHENGSKKSSQANVILIRSYLENQLQNLLLFCLNSPQAHEWHLSIIELVTLMYQDPQLSLHRGFSVSESYSKSVSSFKDSVYDSLNQSDSSDSEESSLSNATTCLSSVHGVHGSCVGSRFSDDGITSAPSYKQKVHAIIVREKLHELATNLLASGCDRLLFGVKAILAGRNPRNLSSIYFSWNLSFFVTTAQRFNLPFSYVKDLTSLYTVDYLIYIAVTSCEKILVAQQRSQPLATTVREANLALVAIKNIFKCLDFYSTATCATDQDKDFIKHMQDLFAGLVEFREMFVLLIRHYQPGVHPLSYLKNLVSLNHHLLTMVEACDPRPFDMLTHVRSFATNTMMSQYGELLTRSQQCSSTLLDEVFTMMHHVALDLHAPSSLLQLNIMQALCGLEQDDRRLSKDAKDLIKYIFSLFMEEAQSNPMLCAQHVLSLEERNTVSRSSSECGWNGAELELLLQACLECGVGGKQGPVNSVDKVSDESLQEISQRLQHEHIYRNQQEILVEMQHQGWARPDSLEQAGKGERRGKEGSPCRTVDSKEESVFGSDLDGDLAELLVAVQDADLVSEVTWLQQTMLELCYVKLGGRQLGRGYSEEPVTLHHVLRGLSLPLITYTERQGRALASPSFQALLASLGIRANADQVFPRIPGHWKVQEILEKAAALAPLPWDKIKFTEEDVRVSQAQQLKSAEKTTSIDFSPSADSQSHNSDMWMMYISKLNKGGSKPANGNQVATATCKQGASLLVNLTGSHSDTVNNERDVLMDLE